MATQFGVFPKTALLLRCCALLASLPPSLLLPNASGQVLVWTEQVELSVAPVASGVASDLSGNIYLTGSFEETARFGTHSVSSAGLSDLFLAKYDPSGNLLWVQTAGGEVADHGADVATDASGNVYVTGAFQGLANFGSTNLAAVSTDLFVCKYDGEGNLVWVRQGNPAVGRGIAADPGGNTVVTGYSGDPTNPIAIIEKRDASGNLLWRRQLTGSGHSGARVKVDSHGSVYAAGYFRGTTVLGPTTLASHGRADAFLAKLDSTGTFLWAQQAGGVADDESTLLALDPSGNPVFAGYFRQVATFGQTNLSTVSPTANSVSAGFLAKYDANGDLLWAKYVDGEPIGAVGGLAVDSEGGIWLNLSRNASPTEQFVAKLDENGNVLWAIPSTVAVRTVAFGLALSPDKRAHIVNSFRRITFGGPDPRFSIDGHSFTNIGGGDIFLMQITEEAPPLITQQPVDSPFALQVGGSHTFAVAARSAYPVSYQWYLAGTDLPGATNASLDITNATLADEGRYFVVASNEFGSSTSSVAGLTIYFELTLVTEGSGSVSNHPPGNVATFHPQFYTNGSSVTLTAVTTSDIPFVDWSGDLSGTDNPAIVEMHADRYIIASFGDAATYMVIDDNDHRASFSGAWTLSSSANNYGTGYRRVQESVVANAEAIYRPLITRPGLYDVSTWFPAPPRQGVANVPWSIFHSGGSLTTRVDQVFLGGRWVLIGTGLYFEAGTNGYVSVSNETGLPFGRVAADAVRFVASRAPLIVAPPQSQTVKCGANATLTVKADGTPPLSYQWRFNGADIPNATSTNLTIVQVQPSHAGRSSVAVSNFLAVTTSSNALLEVTPPPPPLFSSSFVDGAGQFQLTLSGDSGVTFAIEVSTNLTDWTERTNVVVTSGFAQFSEPLEPAAPARFYRARWFPR